jgi:betaine-homocysteine S-methyltransferase
MPKLGILERLSEGVVLGDGGYLLELEKRGYVQAGPFTPEVSISHPQALAELHREFVRAGSEVLQTLTYYASEAKLETVGLGGKMEEINRAAVRIAREVAGESDREVLVAGNISNTWEYDPADPASADRVRKLFDDQLALQMEEGIDFVIGETYSWLGEALIAVEASKRTGLPVMVTMAPDNSPNSLEGYPPAECARRLEAAGADVVGLNCLRDPEHVLPLMEEVRAAVSCYVACQPAGYHSHDDRPNFVSTPNFPLALDPLQLPRAPFAEFALRARDMGMNYLGGCCGAVAIHIREMAKALGKLPLEEREWRSRDGRVRSGFELQHTDRGHEMLIGSTGSS